MGGKRRNLSPGVIVESLELLENLGRREYCKEMTTYWKCKCLKCGNIVEVPQKNLGKAQKDCGCWRSAPKKLIAVGETFGRLTVIEIGDREKDRGYYYWCECSCEKHTRLQVRGDKLRCGEVKSCGCIHDELFHQNVTTAHKNNFVNGTHVGRTLSDDIQCNNTSGYRGVSWHRRVKKWQARIAYQNKTYHLGYYDTPEEASEAYKAAKEAIKKDFNKWLLEKYPEELDKIKKNRK